MLEDTQIPAPRVPITDTAVTSRPWFRFFSNLYDFIGLGNGVVPETSGGTGNTAYATGDLLYASAPNVLSRLPVPGSPCYLGTDATNMPQWIPVAYAAYSDSVGTSWTVNTPSKVTFDTIQYERNITNGGSKVNIQKTGLYTIIATFQLTNANNANDDDIVIWLRLNGADIPNTASTMTIVKEHGGIPGSNILAVNFFLQLTAGDYFELYGLSKLGYAQLTTYAASSSPAYPASPSVILTVAQIV
jgi:hypothetical protein